MDGLLSGKLTYVFLVSILDATVLALAALIWVRRSVQTLMRRRGTSTEAVATVQDQPSVDRPDPGTPTDSSFALFESNADQSTAQRTLTLPSRNCPAPASSSSRTRLAPQATRLVITTLQFAGEEPSLPSIAWLGRWWGNAWPWCRHCVALLVLDRRAIVRSPAGIC